MKKVILDKDDVNVIIERLAIDVYQHIARKHNNLAFIGIQSRGDKIALRLKQLIEAKHKRVGNNYGEIPLGILNINFYRDDLKKNSEAPLVNDFKIDFDITGKHVVLVDDVFYTGRTVRAALDAIFDKGRPAKISMLTLIKRPGRELPVLPEFVGLDLRVGDGEYVKVELTEVEGEDKVTVFDRPN
ncbi:MAG: bifunctional pyr operon transcriptional regulator/uracil phosphoribosyltransferase PyrR [Spirochaetaceae bacterium]|nr:bifunctional pyr operon transcriptional regulator/uracil phosphoribosyltransferase PyrR [Spirochaetaceae bacterium]